MKNNLFSFQRKREFSYDYKVDRVLKKFFAILILTLIVTQVVMLNDSVRGLLTNDYELEGRPLAVNEMLFNEGKLRLQLININPDPKIYITVNGDEVASFQTTIAEVKVKDGDILGINCTGSTQKGEIEIVSKTPNILNNCVGKRFTTSGDPKGTLRIKVDSTGK